jgi:nucleoside-diphosphate-sugar epimerase
LASKTHIGILGCGWLGKSVAEVLLSKKYKVKGTTTSSEKLQTLQKIGVKAFLVELKPEYTSKEFQLFLENLDVLVIAIPPQLKSEENHLLIALKHSFEQFNFSSIKKLIYISSTGVFSDGINKIYDENSVPNNLSFRGKSLMDLEDFIRNQNSISQVSILRYGGLIENGGRHPALYLTGRHNIKNPNAPINLIELKDAINLLISIIEKTETMPVYHGVYPKHPNRQNYYIKKTKELNIDLPVFEKTSDSIGKLIKSGLTCKQLNFKFESEI